MLARISRGALLPQLEKLAWRIDKSPAVLKALMDLMRHRSLSLAKEGALRTVSLTANYNNYRPRDDDPRIAGWADVLDRFKVLTKEVAKKRCIVRLEVGI